MTNALTISGFILIVVGVLATLAGCGTVLDGGYGSDEGFTVVGIGVSMGVSGMLLIGFATLIGNVESIKKDVARIRKDTSLMSDDSSGTPLDF